MLELSPVAVTEAVLSLAGVGGEEVPGGERPHLALALRQLASTENVQVVAPEVGGDLLSGT